MDNLFPEVAVGGPRHGLQQAYYTRQKPQERFAKADARYYVLDHFRKYHDTSRPARMFVLPGASLDFEHAWLAAYDGHGAVVGFEQYADVFNLALRRMPHRPKLETWTYGTQTYATYHATYRPGMTFSLLPMKFERFLTLDAPDEQQAPAARSRWMTTFHGANLIWLDLMATISGPVLEPCLTNLGHILDMNARAIPFALTFATQRAKNLKQKGVVRNPDDPIGGYRETVRRWLEYRTRRRYEPTGFYCYGGKDSAHMCLMWGLLRSKR